MDALGVRRLMLFSAVDWVFLALGIAGAMLGTGATIAFQVMFGDVIKYVAKGDEDQLKAWRRSRRGERRSGAWRFRFLYTGRLYGPEITESGHV